MYVFFVLCLMTVPTNTCPSSAGKLVRPTHGSRFQGSILRGYHHQAWSQVHNYLFTDIKKKKVCLGNSGPRVRCKHSSSLVQETSPCSGVQNQIPRSLSRYPFFFFFFFFFYLAAQ
ncbi:hypothetical protein V8C37DRAFT_384728 [Trichoderma ceciliae]